MCIYMISKKTFETIRSFGDNIYTGKITINETERDQSNLLENMVEFNDKSRTRSTEDKHKNTHKSVNALYEGRELTLNAYKNERLPIKATEGGTYSTC